MLTMMQRNEILNFLVEHGRYYEIPKNKEATISNNELLYHLAGDDEDSKEKFQSRMDYLRSEGILQKTQGGGGGVWRWNERELEKLIVDLSSQDEKFFYPYLAKSLPTYFEEVIHSSRKYEFSNIANKRGPDQPGRHSRPDFVGIGVWQSILTNQKRISTHTIEVKTAKNLSIASVGETVCHRDIMESNYLLVCNINDNELESRPDYGRMFSLCWQLDVGLILAPDVEDISTWTEKVFAKDDELTVEVENWLLEQKELHPKLRKLGLNVPK
ncbi:MAG: hypothetical protein SF002_05665 [Alphaproteobacteria bacterium]|nr:hypothetical protein [Alphaproteobacteria bacterium]